MIEYEVSINFCSFDEEGQVITSDSSYKINAFDIDIITAAIRGYLNTMSLNSETAYNYYNGK